MTDHEYAINKIQSHAWVTGLRVENWGDGSIEDALNAYGAQVRRQALNEAKEICLKYQYESGYAYELAQEIAEAAMKEAKP